MAFTTQSASEYIKAARIQLVEELTNLPVILENLNQKGVLSNEEVSKIQSEKDDYDKRRKILDSVVKKGDRASYEFLRIVDVMMKRKRKRKRISGRRFRLPERKTLTSTETNKFDLDYWISCFPFHEDTYMETNYLQGSSPCYRYQAKLKSKAQKMSHEFWKANKKLFGKKQPDLSYMSLVLDTEQTCPSKVKTFKRKKIKKSRPKKIRTYIPEDKAETSPRDLLKKEKDILLVGKPGIGKTALAHEMLKLWAERDTKDLDYMFYFDMRSQMKEALSLEDLLFGVFSEPDEGKEEVLKDIKDSDSVTLIFDGITDLSVHPSVVQSLVKKELLPDAKIIVTCRPDDEEEFPNEDILRVEVKGFSEQTIKTYLSAMPGEEQKKVLNNLELLSLCYVPMYALMVAACSSFETAEDSPQPSSISEIYINIVRHCIQINSKTKTKDLNSFISNKSNEILSLAEVAFHATEEKMVNLSKRPSEDGCVLSFLKQLVIKVAPTETITTYAFLHYTMQEFFAALWLLKNPDQIKDVFQQCLTEEKKHMKHLIPFMCRLLTEKSPGLMEYLVPAEELKNISSWFFEEMITTFHNNAQLILFLCQCMYESQCPAACVCLLDKLDYHLDLSDKSLHSYYCCAVAYVVHQSKERKVGLNLQDASLSEEGLRRLLGCLHNVQCCDPLPQQLWNIFLLSEGQMDHMSLQDPHGNQLLLPVEGEKQLFERAVNLIQKMTTKVNVCLLWERETPVYYNLCESLLEVLPHLSSLSFRMSSRGPGPQDQRQHQGTLEKKKEQLLLDLCLKAAFHQEENAHNVVNKLLSLFSVNTDLNYIFDCYQHVKSGGFSDDIPKLKPLFQSAPPVWSIDLSKTKTSILLEVLKLQSEKKPVELINCSDEESEVRSFLQCLPYISQLRFRPWWSDDPLGVIRVSVSLFCAAAEREHQTGEKILDLLSSVCSYPTFPLDEINEKEKYQCDVLLGLSSHLKDYETTTGLSVLPSLQSLFQSVPQVWFIDLSKTKTSILLEVLKLQSEKKPVELIDCSDEESEVRSFLQCLPYISQLRFRPRWSDPRWSDDPSGVIRFIESLFCAATEREHQTGEKILELLSSVCSYPTFPLDEINEKEKYQCDVLLGLSSHLKDYETTTGLSVLPSLQSLFQSVPPVWFIDLSKTKTSILLEVLKLQSEKKPVELINCSDEESEVRSFLQCLPYISQLRFRPRWSDPRWSDDPSGVIRFLESLFCAAAEREHQTGEKILELLSSVCSYPTFPLDEINEKEKYQCDVLLGLSSHLKDYETTTGLSVLPSLQSLFQSVPPVWFIDLSKTKTSILLEVLKLQSEKKPVELINCSDEESEVRSILQYLPYISQLRFRPWWSDPRWSDDPSGVIRFLVSLFCAAAEREHQTGEKILELLSSVCSYPTFPLDEINEEEKYQCDVLLGLSSHLKDYETTTGLSVLPSLQSLFQSAPPVWFIDLSETKTSILLEVLKLQSEKKPVELIDGSEEESEVRSFLQCLPYISQLRLSHGMALLLCRWVRRERVTGQVTIEELSLAPQTAPSSQRQLLKVVSSLASLLRSWRVRRLDLVEFCVPGLGLVPLLLHDCPLKIKLNEKMFLQLLSLLYEVQDKDLTWSFLSKVGGDLTSCCLNWELLHYLLQQPSAPTITVNMRKNSFLQESIAHLLPFLDRIVFKRPCPSFVLAAIRELYRAGAGPIVPSLLRSLDHVISLTCREMDSVDCAALLFTLKHSDRVKLDLLWTSIPAGELQSILFMLDKVSQLSVDRKLLLSLVHCCPVSETQQLLRTVQHRLDLSCSSSVDLDQRDSFRLTADDCRAVSTILRRSCRDTQLILLDCEVEDGGLDLLVSVLDRVHLKASKDVLVQLVSLVPVNNGKDTARRAVSLCRALGGELDLSHTRLDQRVCGALAWMLDFSAELTELDLSHCELTDQLLLLLSAHLHKIQVLDLSHNNITDASTNVLLQLVSTNTSINTVRLFGNNIVETTSFKEHKHFEIWRTGRQCDDH